MKTTTVLNSEARDALREVERVKVVAKNLVLMEFLTLPLVLFGGIWMAAYGLGFLYQQSGFRLFGQYPGRVAGALSICGSIIVCVSVMLKLRFANPIRSGGGWFERFGPALLPLIWFLFYFATVALHSFESGRQESSFNALYWMLMFVVYGFWFSNGLLLWIGGLVSAWALTGYFFLGDYYSLWMAVLAGGTIFGGGLYAKFRYVRCKDGEGR